MPRSFRLLDTLGEGAYGVVHLAEVDAGEGFVQRLAVKWLHPQWSHDDGQVRRLRDEARLLALLHHDRIVRVYGLTRIGGRLAILMEPVDGVDLSRLRPGETVPPGPALAIAEGVADALDAAWETVAPGTSEPLRVVHRDIKPSNVMVTSRGTVKVMDFGVARATFETREARTRSQQFGTARYMAPERWLEGLSDAPSDVFSLGITLIEIVSGKPVEQCRLSADSYAADRERALAHLDPWPPLRDLVRKMTEYRPSERPTAAEVKILARELRAQFPEPEVEAWAAGWVGSNPPRQPARSEGIIREDTSADTSAIDMSLVAVTATAAVPIRPKAAPAPGRSRLIAQVTAVVAATVLVVIGFQYLRGGSNTQTTADASPTPVSVETVPESTPIAPATVPAPPVAETKVPDPPPEPVSPVTRPPIAKVTPPVEPTPVVVPAEPPVETVRLTVLFDPKYEVELVPGGRVSNRTAVEFKKGEIIRVLVNGQQSCTVIADPSHNRLRIDPEAERPCGT